MKNKKDKTICKVKVCPNLSKSPLHQLCGGHLLQFYRHGEILNKPLRQYRRHKVISVKE